MIEISIIIVSYNTESLLKDCINSIYHNSKSNNYEIIVVDNNSSDNSILMLKNNFPAVRIIQNKENLGFGAANNRGASQANGEYLLFLNSDTVFQNDALKYFMAASHGRELLGAYLRAADGTIGTSFCNYTTFIKSTIRLLYMSFPLLFNFRKLLFKPKNHESHDMVVQVVTGADIFISKNNFIFSGGFDERYFMYFEDDDLCRTVGANGIVCKIIAGPLIVHKEGASSSNAARKICIIEGSLVKYLCKYNPNKIGIYKRLLFIIMQLRWFSPAHTLNEKKMLFKHIKEITRT
jgi:GT2 family glycosyltransferase